MAFLTDSKILLLDEITAALDRINSEKVMNIVYKKCQQTCKTCLMITHSPQIILQFENNVAILDNGKIRKQGG
jgi:putative ABC transport system ATP-binding protein